mgnify:FL=1
MEETKEKVVDNSTAEKKINRKKLFIILGSVVGAVLVIYVGLSIFFMSHFYFNTTLNGKNVSGYSADKVFDNWEDEIGNYSLKIVESDGTESELKGSDIDMVLQWDDTIAKMISKQNGFAWPAKLFNPDQNTSEAIVTFDEDKLDSALDGFSFMDKSKQIDPVDATVSDYDKNDGYTLVESVPGTAIDKPALKENIEKALYGLADTYQITEGNGYLAPKIANDDEKLLAAIDTMNKYAGSEIDYEIGSEKETLDINTFADWLSINDNEKVEIDEEKVADYVAELGTKYNTYGKSKQLATSYGTTITMSNCHYGWKIDAETEAAAIVDDIKGGEKVTRDLNYQYTAASHTGNDYGNSYVEINLTAQHLYLYKNGSLVIDSDFVSGNPSKGNATHTGVFGVTYTERNATLKGQNYATPVSFWMPFNGNEGMHDATWRSSFGGSIYKRNGSHGCVNLPYSVAQTIFENVSAGFPVFVYELAGTESQKGIDQDAAAAVDSAISAIGEVTAASGDVIAAARASYDALSDSQKSYVTKYQQLADSEAAYAAIMASMAPVQ